MRIRPEDGPPKEAIHPVVVPRREMGEREWSRKAETGREERRGVAAAAGAEDADVPFRVELQVSTDKVLCTDSSKYLVRRLSRAARRWDNGSSVERCELQLQC